MFTLSVRNEYEWRRKGRAPICRTCRRPEKPLTPAELERFRRWWLEESGLSVDELREIAFGLDSSDDAVPTLEPLDFNAFVDLLRIRLGRADAVKESDLHSFKDLMFDYAEVTPNQWYWEAFETLQFRGHLHDQSALGNGGNAFARLSAAGREHLRAIGEL